MFLYLIYLNKRPLITPPPPPNFKCPRARKEVTGVFPRAVGTIVNTCWKWVWIAENKFKGFFLMLWKPLLCFGEPFSGIFGSEWLGDRSTKEEQFPQILKLSGATYNINKNITFSPPIYCTRSSNILGPFLWRQNPIISEGGPLHQHKATSTCWQRQQTAKQPDNKQPFKF